MKKTLAIMVIALAMFSCSKSPEQIAQQLIKESLLELMDDPKSYEPVEFGTLDSTFTTLDDYQPFNDAYDKYMDCKAAAETYESTASTAKWNEDYEGQIKFLKLANEMYDKAETYRQQALDSKKTFKPQFNGWKMTHKFRCKNAFGAVMLNEIDLYFDKELTQIIGRGEIK